MQVKRLPRQKLSGPRFGFTVFTGDVAAYRQDQGLGPNFNVNLKDEMTNTSMVLAAGATLPFGELYIPVNFAVAFSDGGPRITSLLGWIVG